MNNNKFQLSRLLEIYETDSRKFQQSKDYINQYFFLTAEGNYYYWTGSDFQNMSKEAFIEVYLNRFPKEIKNWFKHENVKYTQQLLGFIMLDYLKKTEFNI